MTTPKAETNTDDLPERCGADWCIVHIVQLPKGTSICGPCRCSQENVDKAMAWAIWEDERKAGL